MRYHFIRFRQLAVVALTAVVVIAVVGVIGIAMASSNGNKTGRSQTGCGGCHGSTRDANGDVTVSIAGPTSVNTSETNTYLVTVTGTPTAGGGLDLSVTGGALTAGANNQVRNGEITNVDGASTSWAFSWTAPSIAGTETMYVAGLGTNNDGSTSGDSWDLASLAISVVEPTPPPTPPPTPSPTPPPTLPPTPPPTPTPTPGPTLVGGVAEFVDPGSDSGAPSYGAVAGVTVAVLVAIALGSWYTRRRWLLRRRS